MGVASNRVLLSSVAVAESPDAVDSGSQFGGVLEVVTAVGRVTPQTSECITE